MDFCLFVLFYLICTFILSIIVFWLFRKYFADKIVSSVIKEAFDNNDIDTNIVNLTDTLNDMNNDSQEDTNKPRFF